MPHGGAAAKLGDRYEGRIAIWRLLELIDDTHDSVKIRFEQPGLDDFEWWVEHEDGSRTYTQVKRQNSSPTAWTIGDLKKVLVGFRALLEHGARAKCVFHSTLSASHLQEFHECSRRTADLNEFKREIAGTDWQKSWSTLLGQWPGDTEEQAWLWLREISSETISEEFLQRALHGYARALVVEDPANVISRLGSFLEDQVGQELTAQDVWHFLTDVAHMHPTDWSKDQNLHLVVRDSTSRFQARIADDRTPLAEIVCSETADVADALLDRDGPASVTLVAGAGVGKSGALGQVIDQVATRGRADADHPGVSGPLVLAARLDAIDPFDDAKGLGRAMGLPASPGLVLSRLAAGRPALLVLDQVDAFGSSSGRKPLRLGAVAEAVRDARTLGVRVLLACREFDLEMDSSLADLVGADQPPGCSAGDAKVVKLRELSTEDVDAVLRDRGLEPDSLNGRLRELLRIPLHLRLFATLHDRGKLDLSALDTRLQLFDQFLRYVRDEVQVIQPHANIDDVNDALAKALSDRQELYTPVTPSGVDSTTIERMAAAGWLRLEHGRISFAHEAFFDYAYAMRHLRTGTRLLDLLKSGPQHLFRRAQVRQILALERDRDRSLYLREVRDVLGDSAVRAHVKELVIGLVTSVLDPTVAEWEALGVLGQTGIDPLADRAHLLAARQESFGGFLLDQGIIANDLTDPGRAPVAAWMCVSLVRHHPEQVISLMEPHVGEPQWRSRLMSVVTAGQQTGNARVYDLLSAMIEAGDLDESVRASGAQHDIFTRLYQLTGTRAAWGARVASAWVRRRAELLAADGAFSPSAPIDDTEPDDEADGADLRESVRRAALRLQKESKTALLLDGLAAPQVLATLSQQDPSAFVRHMLPAVRHAADVSRTGEVSDDGEQCLVLSRLQMSMGHSATAAAFRRLSQAVRTAVSAGDTDAISAVREMAGSPLVVDQALAAAGFEAAHPDLLVGAAEWLAKGPYALGQVRSAHVIGWVCRELPVAESTAIQQRVAEYVPDFEADNAEFSGRSAQRLLAGIPEDRLTDAARDRKTELDKRFPPLPQAAAAAPGLDLSMGLSDGAALTPIDSDALSHMTTSQLVDAVLAHPGGDLITSWDNASDSIAVSALARQLAAQVHSDVERFVLLLEALPAESAANYSSVILEELTRSEADTSQLVRAAHAARTHAYECQQQIATLIHHLAGRHDAAEFLADDEIDDLIDLARSMFPTEPLSGQTTDAGQTIPAHSIDDPEDAGGADDLSLAGEAELDDLLQDLDSATWSLPERAPLQILTSLAGINPRADQALHAELRRLAAHPDIAVRSLIIGTIAQTNHEDVDAAVDTVHTALGIGPEGEQLDHLAPLARATLSASSDLHHLLLRLCWQRYDLVSPILRTMLDLTTANSGTPERAAYERAAQSAAGVVIVAACRHPEALQLLPEASEQPVRLRRGMATAFSQTLPLGEITEQVVGQLIALFDDPDDETASQAAMALYRIPDAGGDLAGRLLPAALTARSFGLNPDSTIRCAEQFADLMPETALDIAKRFFDEFGPHASDISTAAAYQATVLGKLVVGVYAKNLGDTGKAERALDLIDAGVLAHAYGIEEHLELHGR